MYRVHLLPHKIYNDIFSKNSASFTSMFTSLHSSSSLSLLAHCSMHVDVLHVDQQNSVTPLVGLYIASPAYVHPYAHA